MKAREADVLIRELAANGTLNVNGMYVPYAPMRPRRYAMLSNVKDLVRATVNVMLTMGAVDPHMKMYKSPQHLRHCVWRMAAWRLGEGREMPPGNTATAPFTVDTLVAFLGFRGRQRDRETERQERQGDRET